MFKRFRYFLFFTFVFGCIEPYTFLIPADSQSLVVEAFISDKSFTDTKAYPSDGRYFSVTLSYTGEVTNLKSVLIFRASVSLINDRGEQWEYTESMDSAGTYYLLNENFKALKGVKYKLRIYPPNDTPYETDWEGIPDIETPIMGKIGFTETEVQRYIIESSEPVLRSVKGVAANISVPENNTQERIFYRWEFTPLWIYVAPLTPASAPFYRCWVTDRDYISDYVLQPDVAGGYKKEVFFLETIRNERLFEDLSVLVLQYSINEEYYSFWSEMQQQVQGGPIFDNPPYNLRTNFHAIDGGKQVSGYFGVVQEQAKRWYFNIGDLSYIVQNTLKGDCLVPHGPPWDPPAEECLDCRFYSFGTATTTKPPWWRQ